MGILSEVDSRSFLIHLWLLPRRIALGDIVSDIPAILGSALSDIFPAIALFKLSNNHSLSCAPVSHGMPVIMTSTMHLELE